jgi:hypothetical protein
METVSAPYMAGQSENTPSKLGVMSPFDSSQTGERQLPPSSGMRGTLIVLYTLVAVLAVAVVVILVWKRTVNNPYRTLETFSADKYFDNPTALIGNRFQATLRVEGDLGWNEKVGKLMVFSVDGDSRYIPVLIQGNNLSYSFSKGQTYLAQIEVKEGGTLYASDIRKN